MQFYEIDSLLDNYYLKNKDGWEQARLIAYMTAQVNSREKLSPNDIITFHWEKDNNVVDDIEDIKELELEMKRMEDIMNNKS